MEEIQDKKVGKLIAFLTLPLSKGDTGRPSPRRRFQVVRGMLSAIKERMLEIDEIIRAADAVLADGENEPPEPKVPIASPDDMLAIGPAAKILGINRETLRRLRGSDNAPPCSQLPSGRIRYRRKDLDEFINSRRIGPTPAAVSQSGDC